MRFMEIGCKRSLICRFLLISSLLLLLVANSAETSIAQPTSLTLNCSEQLSVGGVSTLDRAQFFTHTSTLFPPSSTTSNAEMRNLRLEIYSEDGLNLTVGRISTELDQFLANGLPEDPARPGFADPTELQNRLQGDYRNFVLNGSRYESLRDSVTRPIFVNSGRSSTLFFDAAFRTGEQSNLFPNRVFYADYLRTFLREVVYGPNAFYPLAADRYHLEIINEPDLHLAGIFGGPSAAASLLASSQELAEYHRDIAQMVKSEFSSASIGGPSLAVTDMAANDYLRWNSTMKPFIDIAGADLDYYSIHPYERYDVQANQTVRRAVDQSHGRINSQIDMIRNRQEQAHGNRLPLSITEYSSFNRGVNGSMANGSYAGYDRDVQQWDQSRNLREQLLVYINRPDAILNAVPFIFASHFRNEFPNRDSDDNVIYERDSTGAYLETIIGHTMRIYAPVKGDYIKVQGANGDLQAVAFRDGDQVYLLLNNLLNSTQTLDLNLLLGGTGVVNSASISRVYRDAAAGNVFVEDQDITNTFNNLVLNPKEGAVITFDVGSDFDYTRLVFDETYYGDQIAVELNDGFIGRTPEILINADITDAIAAKLRVGYTRPVGVDSFLVAINGNTITATGEIRGVDDEEFGSIDEGLVTREIDIPIEFLNNGDNALRLTFTGSGFVSSTALVVSTAAPGPSLGDVSLDGVVNFLDIAPFIALLQSGTFQAEADINFDGVVDFLDIGPFIDLLISQ